MSFKMDRRGQAGISYMSIFVFFILYFSFIMFLIWMVEGITPMYLTENAALLGLSSLLIVSIAVAGAALLERGVAFVGTGVTGAPVSAWHSIRFAILAAIGLIIGWPLYNSVNQSTMFTELWMTSLFVTVPFIIFSGAAFMIAFTGGD